jgi:DUF971 family protein
MTLVPTDLRASREQGVLTVCWGERQADFPFVFLRGQCECAHCVNEWTGEKILDPGAIPRDIAVERMELVGGYAVRIHWSDGHNSGLFTWERLAELRGEF